MCIQIKSHLTTAISWRCHFSTQCFTAVGLDLMQKYQHITKHSNSESMQYLFAFFLDFDTSSISNLHKL